MGSETSLITQCKEGFSAFIKYLDKINDSDNQNKNHDGYLVYYNEYQDFENYINDFDNNAEINEEKIKENNNLIESKKLNTVNINEVNDKILQDNKFIIINNDLHKLICKQNDQDDNNKIVYKIKNDFIEINQTKGKIIQFKNNKNNIIDKSTIKESILYNDMNTQILKHLIKFHFYKKELRKKNNSSQIYKGYLIRSEIINIFKEKYDLKIILDSLEKNNIFNQINYQNFDSNFQKIIQILNENDSSDFNGIKKIKSQEIPNANIITLNENLISKKFISKNLSKLIYLDEFEIIDQDFAFYLKGLYKNKIQIIQVNYILIESKIILSINYEQKYIYEIVYINPEGGNIIVEYLIEPIINNNNISTDINSIIFQPFQKNGLIKLISLGQSLKINDSISIYIHKIINKALNHSKTLKYFNVPNDIRNLLPFSSNKNKSISNKEISKNQILDYNIRKGYLIDQKFFKSMSPILNLDNNNAYYTKFFEAKIDFKSNKIQNASLTKNNIVFYYPINFYIINNETFDKINKTANNTLKINLFEEINFIKVNGGIIFAPKNNNFLFNNNNLIYIYSSKKIEQAQLNEPIAIIECNNIVDRNNKFNLINKELSNKNVVADPVGYFNGIKLSCFLINNNSSKNINMENSINTITKRNINNYSMLDYSAIKLEDKANNISDKLKVLILLEISNKYIDYDNKLERIYLINPKWAEEYKYNEIKLLINQKYNEIINKWNKSYELNSLYEIIPLFNKEQLKSLDQKINTNNNLSINNISERIELQDKYIDIFKEFIIVNNQMLKLFQKYFFFKSNDEEIFYVHKKGGNDLIIVKNHKILDTQNNQIFFQNSIFVGTLNKEENKFDIKHILDYINNNILNEEIDMILKNNYLNYLLNRTLLNMQNKQDMVELIFNNNNQIIGNFYIYRKNYNYKIFFNYYNLLYNNQLWTVIYLYVNELSIKEKLKKINTNNEEFYLIKKEHLIDIKNKNNFFELKKFFYGKLKSTFPSQKEIYNLFKSLKSNQLNEFTEDLKQKTIHNILFSTNEVEKIEVSNPNNTNESYIIFNNFDLIEKHIAEFIEGKYAFQNLTCTLIGNNMIIFHYPINKLNNKNYFFVVSKYDENNNFKNEYLLIYFNPNYIQSHFNKIKNNLNNYLQNLGFVNNNAPIVINGYQEIGMVIRLSSGISEDEYFPPNPLNITETLKDFPCKPLIGLENIGATCYMNATLQCLCNIHKLVNYFKYSKHLENIVRNDNNKEKLSSSFKLLIEKLYPYDLSNNKNTLIPVPNKTNINYIKDLKRSYTPREFKEKISKMNPLFEGITENDAKDLVNFLIMKLHTELNKAPKDPLNISNKNSFEEQKDKNLMLNKFMVKFTKAQNSIISDLFYAMNCTSNKCNNCQIIFYNYQIYFFLLFPLEEVRKFKLMNNNGFINNNFNLNNNIVDIYDCFNYDMRINLMSGNNAMYCNYCKQTCNNSMCTTLTTGPEILIIILNRGKGNMYNVKINFYLEINLYNYIELKETGTHYELFGVITHLGESIGGRYIAYCKSYWDNQWFKFDDAFVNPVQDFKSEVIDYAMPYLLFYQKK